MVERLSRSRDNERRPTGLDPQGGIGGGAGFILFQPIDVCEGIGQTCDCVLSTVLTSSCDSVAAPGDEVEVWDLARGFLQLPDDLLFSSTGMAHYLKIHESAYESGLPFELGECRWVVTGMYCIEETA